MVHVINANWQSPSDDYSPSERDADVLLLIETEDFTLFTFDGIKRRTGLHSETLSRILTRLEAEGIIKKEHDGYHVTPKITQLNIHHPHTKTPTTTLIQTFLPSDIMTQRLILQLRGKWFGMLRWIGISETPQGITLKWITEDGAIQIAANIEGTTLNIEAKFLTNNNLNLALKASYQLMSLIGKFVTSSRSSNPVTTQTASYFNFYTTA